MRDINELIGKEFEFEGKVVSTQAKIRNTFT